MSDNLIITAGSGTTIGADEVVDGTLGTVKVQYVKIMDGTLDGTSKAVVGATGLKIDGSAVTQPVSTIDTVTSSGTLGALNATVVLAVAGYTGASAMVFGGANTLIGNIIFDVSTDNQTTYITTYSKDAAAQGYFVTNTFTSPNLGNQFEIVLFPGVTHVRARVSAYTSGSVTCTLAGTKVQTKTLWTYGKDSTLAARALNCDNIGNLISSQLAATLVISTTAATGVAVTATLPAVALNFHYISLIEITKYFTAANAASATPLVVTTTNLPGSLAYTFGQPLGTIGTSETRIIQSNSPIKSSVVNTNTTIVCPATTGIIWRLNVYYYTTP